jgi:hypothetical protein
MTNYVSVGRTLIHYKYLKYGVIEIYPEHNWVRNMCFSSDLIDLVIEINEAAFNAEKIGLSETDFKTIVLPKLMKK